MFQHIEQHFQPRSMCCPDWRDSLFPIKPNPNAANGGILAIKELLMKIPTLALLAMSCLLTACSEQEISQQMRTELTTALAQECVNHVPPELKLTAPLAEKYCRCAADTALKNASVATLTDLVKNGGKPSPELQSQLIEAASSCVLNSNGTDASAPSSSSH